MAALTLSTEPRDRHIDDRIKNIFSLACNCCFLFMRTAMLHDLLLIPLGYSTALPPLAREELLHGSAVCCHDVVLTQRRDERIVAVG
jgi:hypothetical protein